MKKVGFFEFHSREARVLWGHGLRVLLALEVVVFILRGFIDFPLWFGLLACAGGVLLFFAFLEVISLIIDFVSYNKVKNL